MLSICDKAGFTLQASKVSRPARVIECLGIVIDVERFELPKSREWVSEIWAILAVWRLKRVGTKRELQSLVGKLAFDARIVRTGRTCLGPLIGLSERAKQLHLKVRL